MPMQPARPLQQQIHRGKITEHTIEIKIHGLLNYLRGYHNQTLWPIGRIRPQPSHQILLNPPPFKRQEPRMNQYHFHINSRADLRIYFLRSPHRIAHHPNATAKP